MSENSLVDIVVAIIGVGGICLGAWISRKKGNEHGSRSESKNVINQSSLGDNSTQIGIQNNYGGKHD